MTTHTNFLQEMVLGKISSELAIELAWKLHGAWLDKVWWLNAVKRSPFIVQLTLAFDPALFCAREHIAATDRIYVVSRGLCMHGAKILSKNDCWGLDLMLTQGHLRQLRTTIAITYLHVLFLPRDALLETMEHFPKEKQMIRRSYRLLCVMRGIVYKANQIKADQRRQKKLTKAHHGVGSMLNVAMGEEEAVVEPPAKEFTTWPAAAASRPCPRRGGASA